MMSDAYPESEASSPAQSPKSSSPTSPFKASHSSISPSKKAHSQHQEWASNPVQYIDDFSSERYGKYPTFVITQVSITPVIFQCQCIVSEEDNLKTISVGPSRKVAENSAAILMCLAIDTFKMEMLRNHFDRSKYLTSEPNHLMDRKWWTMPKNHLYSLCFAKYSREPIYTVDQDGNSFITTVVFSEDDLSNDNLVGRGIAGNKKQSSRLAALDLCSKLDKLEIDSNQAVNETEIADLGKYLASEPEDFLKKLWKDKPKDELFRRVNSRWGTIPKYDTKQLPGHPTVFLATVRCSDDWVGRGRGSSIKEACRLAAIDLCYQMPEDIVISKRQAKMAKNSREQDVDESGTL